MTYTHVLKTVPPYYDAVASGMKTFEIRTFDRPFEVGHALVLREYVDGKYTGQAQVRIITYLMDDPEYVLPGTVVLGLRPLTRREKRVFIAGMKLVSDEAVAEVTAELSAGGTQRD